MDGRVEEAERNNCHEETESGHGTGQTGKTLLHRRPVRARQYQQDIQENRPVQQNDRDKGRIGHDTRRGAPTSSSTSRLRSIACRVVRPHRPTSTNPSTRRDRKRASANPSGGESTTMKSNRCRSSRTTSCILLDTTKAPGFSGAVPIGNTDRPGTLGSACTAFCSVAAPLMTSAKPCFSSMAKAFAIIGLRTSASSRQVLPCSDSAIATLMANVVLPSPGDKEVIITTAGREL